MKFESGMKLYHKVHIGLYYIHAEIYSLKI